MKRTLLIILFVAILAAMLAVTIRASLDRGIFESGSELMAYPWFHATLVDAYLGFLTFYVWVAYKETGVVGRLLWLLAIMALGNIAMSIYVLLQLWQWDEQDGPQALLLRKGS